MNAIIATNLYTTRKNGPVNRDHHTHKGCKELIPVFDAIAPVMKGKSAEPTEPNPAIHPIEPSTHASVSASSCIDLTRDVTGQQPSWQHPSSVVHRDRIHRSQ
jgi:hypothetical protein